MAFLSELIGKTVTDLDGAYIGKLEDVLAHYPKEFTHPVVSAIIIRKESETHTVPYSHVTALTAQAILINAPIYQIEPYKIGDHDIHLVRDVMDKQIIDINGVRVVRVNDLELIRIADQMVASNVDIGAWGILRRVGLEKMIEKLFHMLGRRPPHSYISWDHVELMWQDDLMRLKVTRDKIADLHPADIVAIISDMSQLDGRKFIESLDVPQLADTLEEVETDFQVSLVQHLSDEKVADVLEEMAPDAAADLLGGLPEDRSRELLGMMDAEDAEDVRKLLTYPVDSAGGLMTTEYVAIPIGLTAEQAINYLRENAAEAETIFYVYVTDNEDHLVGVFSLRDLVLARPDTLITEFMHKRVVTAKLDENQNHIAMLVAKYNLLAIPVVDDTNCLQGIVTSDDALDQIIPTAWKKRMPRLHQH